MRHLQLALALLLLASPLLAADVHVNASSSSCSDAGGDGSPGTPYVSLPHAMHAASINCGDTVYLHAGTYQYQMGGTVADGTPANICDDDEYNDGTCSTQFCTKDRSIQCTTADPSPCAALTPNTCAAASTCSTAIECIGGGSCSTSGGNDKNDGSHTVLPIFKDCSAESPLVITNYAGDNVILDGTDTLVASATWTACSSATTCGAVTTGLNLNDSTKTYYTTSLNVGSACTPQIWIDPASATDPGTRLVWDNQASATVTSGHFLCRNSGSPHIIVRMPDDAAPGTHTIKMAQQAGAGAVTVVRFMGASYVTLKSNPAGGHIYIKYGYLGVNMDDYGTFIGLGGGSQHNTVEDVTVLAAGGRDYGIGLRTSNADYATFLDNEVYETSAEALGFYGGGPGGQNGPGVNNTNNLAQGNTLHDTGFYCKDGGASSPCLGVPLIVKNCTDCIVRGNTIYNGYRSAIQVNLSSECGASTCASDNALVERNNVWNYCHDHDNAWPPNQLYNGDCGAILVRDSEAGTANNAVIRNNMVTGQFANPSTSAAASPHGILLDGANGAMTGAKIIHNSISGAGGACIGLEGSGGSHTVTIRGNAMSGCSALGTVFCNGQVCDLYNDKPANWTVTHSNNTYWAATDVQVVRQSGGSGYTRSQVVGSWEASAVQDTPGFTSASDLHIVASGNCAGVNCLINGGTSTDAPSDDFDGQARSGNPDIGADEFVSTSRRRIIVTVSP